MGGIWVGGSKGGMWVKGGLGLVIMIKDTALLRCPSLLASGLEEREKPRRLGMGKEVEKFSVCVWGSHVSSSKEIPRI